MRRRVYVLTLEVKTDDKNVAALLRSKVKRFATTMLDGDTAFLLTRQEIEWPAISRPVVLMERKVEP